MLKLLIFIACMAAILSGTEVKGEIPSVSPSVSYSCSGGQSYPFTFPAMEKTDIYVKIADPSGPTNNLSYGADYTVTCAAGSGGCMGGGTVSTLAPCAAGNTLTIYRQTPRTQDMTFIEGMPTLYGSFQYGLDKLTLIAQEREQKTDGLITEVSASSPLASSGGYTPNITCQTASISQGGCLSAVDWAIFNGKQAALGFTPENTANKGMAGGYAGLDGGGKVPYSNISGALSAGQSIINTSGVLTLAGDASTPGNDKVYGTDSSGNKGWYNMPSGGGGSGGGITAVTGTPPITASGTTSITVGIPKATALVDGYLDHNDFTGMEKTSNKNASGGYAGLDGGGKVPYANISGAPTVSQSIVNTLGVITLSGDSSSPGNSKVYGTNGSGTKGWYSASGGGDGAFIKRSILTASGTFTTQADTGTILLRMVGGGGGGGSCANTAGVRCACGGGGGGTYGEHIVAVNPLTSYTYTIGAGGARGTYGNNGSSGGDTSITIGGTLYTVWGGGHVTTGTAGGGRTMADAYSMSSVLGGLGGDTCQIGGQSIFGLCMHGHEGYRGIRMADTVGTTAPQTVNNYLIGGMGGMSYLMTYGAGGGGAQGQGYGIAGSPGIIIIDEYTGSTTQAGYAISNSNSFNSVSGVEILGPAESPDVIDKKGD